ncbi:hypothetical protein CapIbe_000598 [Capra ibex]
MSLLGYHLPGLQSEQYPLECSWHLQVPFKGKATQSRHPRLSTQSLELSFLFPFTNCSRDVFNHSSSF